ncbi:MAG: hypothetical protein IJ469_03980, partial [Candidatus Methanomethylophilaceae archaeon]|nr:hypothetical protein [Candidatus Methanomethylophilaceae archaeon]
GSEVSGNVTVKGTFTSEDYENDVQDATITADVSYVSGTAKTWTSLTIALQSAVSGDTITTNGAVKISDDTTIPEGVTVKSDYTITVEENVTLNVAGTLEVNKATNGKALKLTVAAPATNDKDAKLIVTGVVKTIYDGTDDVGNDEYEDVAGAHFLKSEGSKKFRYVTNVAYAASVADEKLESGLITIRGVVDAGTVTFTKSEKADALIIGIEAVYEGKDRKAVVTGDITLDGAYMYVDIDKTDRPVSFTGTVNAAADGGIATMTFKDADGFALASVVDETEVDPVDVFCFIGMLNGDAVVAAGKVTGITMFSGSTLNILPSFVDEGMFESADYDEESRSTINVATGAVLEIDNVSIVVGGNPMTTTGAVVWVTEIAGTEDPSFTVDGEMIIDESDEVIVGNASASGDDIITLLPGFMVVNGIMTVSESSDGMGFKIYWGQATINGTLSVSSEEGKEGTVKVYNGALAVGSKPDSLGGSGTVTGTVMIYTSSVKVYSGSIEKVVNESNTEVEPTTLVINGVEYMTLYSAGTVVSAIIAEKIDLAGLVTPVEDSAFKGILYQDADLKQKVKDQNALLVGKLPMVYMEFDAAEITGTVSAGTGLEIYIDGVRVDSGPKVPLEVGKHTVSISVISGYDGSDATITFDGQTVSNGGTITIDADAKTFTLIASGAVPVANEPVVIEPAEDEGMDLTDILLIVLVVLIVIMAVIVALRMMRS